MKTFPVIYQKSDLNIILNGISKVCYALSDLNSKKANRCWNNSSFKPVAENQINKFQNLSFDPNQIEVSFVCYLYLYKNFNAVNFTEKCYCKFC